MKLKVLSFAAVLFVLCAVPVMAQAYLPAEADVSLSLVPNQPAAPSAVQSLVPPASGTRGWFDDFNRPDGDSMGADWTEMLGDIDILGNEAYEGSGGLSWMLHTSASDNYDTTTIEFDLDPNASGDSRYGAAVIGYNSSTGEDIFVKVQNQTGLPGYSNYGFYHAHNGGAYGTWGGFGSFGFQINGGHVIVYVDNGGDRVNLDIDEDMDGTVDYHYDAPGLIASGLPSLLGTGGGAGLWSNGTMDNWGFNNTGPQLDPRCDIKVNGQDSGAEIFVGANCDITISVIAGVTYGGRTVEIWWGSAKPSYVQLYYSGPLVDVKDTVWSGPLPVGVGSYMVGLGLDGKINGTRDKLYFLDTADFNVVNPPTTYEYDDGSTENLLCWSLGGDICWMHRFDTIPGGETIAEIHCIFGSAMYPNYAPGNGTATNVYVWNDPTDDGDPSDCVLLHTEPTTVQNVDLDVYNIIPLTSPLPVVSGHFYIGCNMTHNASQFCAPIDQTTPYVWGNGFYCGTNTLGGFDPNNLMNNQYTPAEWGNYWCIRAAY